MCRKKLAELCPQPEVFPEPETGSLSMTLDLSWAEVTSVINGVESKLVAGKMVVLGAGSGGERMISF